MPPSGPTTPSGPPASQTATAASPAQLATSPGAGKRKRLRRRSSLLTVDERPVTGEKQTTKVGIRSVVAQTSSLRLSFSF